MNKQIEEIKRTLEIAMCQDLPFIDSCELGAKALYDQGYQKIDENKVVVDKEYLKKELQGLELQARKETATEFIFKMEETLAYYDKYDRIDKGSILEWVGEITKQYGVEI